MANKQTAVMWLEEALSKNLKEIICKCDNELMESLFKQAKEMEREQIEEAYNAGYNHGIVPTEISGDTYSYFTKKFQNGKEI